MTAKSPLKDAWEDSWSSDMLNVIFSEKTITLSIRSTVVLKTFF